MKRWGAALLAGAILAALALSVPLPGRDHVFRLLMRLRGPLELSTALHIVRAPDGLEQGRLDSLLRTLEARPPRALWLDAGLPEGEAGFPVFSHRRPPGGKSRRASFPLVALPSQIDREGNPVAPDPFIGRAVDVGFLASLDRDGSLKPISARILNYVGPPGTVPYSSLEEVEGDPHLQEKLGGAIVLLARSRPDSAAVSTLPFHAQATQREWMEAEVVAGAVETVSGRRGIRLAPPSWTASLTICVSLISAVVILAASPVAGVLSVVLLTGLVFLFAHVSLAHDLFLDISTALLSIALAYYFLIPYRLIAEYKERWKYQEQTKLLAEVETLKDNFMSLVSHNLKTPIAGIQGAVETLLERGDREDLRSELRGVLGSVEDLSRFVSRILSLSRIEDPSYHIQTASRDLNEIVQGAVDSFADAAAGKNVEIVTDLEPLFPVRMEAQLIKESVSNLVENAVKYSPSGGRVTVSTGESGNFVTVRVEDSGPGIAEEDADRIFSKFFRGSAVKNVGERGSGLGLYLVRYFVELHGGTADFSNRPEGGAVFAINLLRH